MKYRKIFALLSAVIVALLMTGCDPDAPNDAGANSSTPSTTSMIGGFVIEEEAPGFDDEWYDVE